jgi:predicted ribosomally synthesized peptide with nif11-like leader
MPENAPLSPSDAISQYFARVREDSGLQGQLNAAFADKAPEEIARIASRHGYNFSADELRQMLKDRAQVSLQGEVFWTMVTQHASLRPAPALRPVFIQITGPSWVQSQPYRRTVELISQDSTRSLSELLREDTPTA